MRVLAKSSVCSRPCQIYDCVNNFSGPTVCEFPCTELPLQLAGGSAQTDGMAARQSKCEHQSPSKEANKSATQQLDENLLRVENLGKFDWKFRGFMFFYQPDS